MNSRVTPLLALIVAVNIFFFYVSATWNGEIASAKSAIDADNQALAAADNYKSQQDQLSAKRNAIPPESLTALANFLPSSVDNVRIIIDLSALAANSRLSVSSIDMMTNSSGSANATNSSGVSSTAGVNPVGSVDLSLSATGTFAALQTFLDGLERSERLLDVHDLSIKGSDTGVYSYQMTIRLYWLR